tara:strand:+ start:28 stop:531 length:504 start_codon:yes stop_codon:yes gene_type:complete
VDSTIRKKVTVDVNRKYLWKIISLPGQLHLFHPFCKNNEVLKWEKEKSVDFIEYYNKKVLKRRFFDWKEEIGYKLIINDLKKDIAEVHWNIFNSRKSKIDLSIEVQILDTAMKKFPNTINKIILRTYVLPKLGTYLDSVLCGVKYFSETGNKVSKNQFGYNSMFSSR